MLQSLRWSDKFFNIVTFDDGVSIRKLTVPTREFLEIEVDAQDAELEDVIKVLEKNFDGQLKEKIIKVRIVTRRRFNPKPIYDFLRRQEVFHYVPIHWDFVQPDKIKKIVASVDMKDKEVVKAYLDKTKVEENLADRILKLHDELEDEVTNQRKVG